MDDCERSPRFGVMVNARGYEETSALGRRALLEQQYLNVPEFDLATLSSATRKDRSFDTTFDTTQNATRRNGGQA
jgi:hypothetical protein